MKDLKKLNGARMLSETEQKTIKGGGSRLPELCNSDYPLVVCYLPTHCAYDEQGNAYCI